MVVFEYVQLDNTVLNPTHLKTKRYFLSQHSILKTTACDTVYSYVESELELDSDTPNLPD